MFIRSHISILRERLENGDRAFIQVIYGPRQVGKTTLVRQFLENTKMEYHYSSADAVPAGNQTWISQQWEIARLRIRKNGEVLLVIDEIQKIDNWSEQVKKEWDADTLQKINIKVLLLGSSRLLLQKGLTESLAGRFEATYMGHWSYNEMHESFGITSEEYAWFGGYPGGAELLRDETRWKNYIRESLIETSISKDILMLTRVDKPALLRRLFELGCEYSGQILSFTKVMGQLADAGNTTTLSHYLQLLDTAGLLSGIEKFSIRKIRQRASSPKFQVQNTALISAQSSSQLDEMRTNPERWGRVVESSIGAHLLAHSLAGDYKVYYWRERNQEVDFVLSKGDMVLGLEVKSGRKQNLAGMDVFQKTFQPNKVLLVGNEGIPWDEFLKVNPREMF